MFTISRTSLRSLAAALTCAAAVLLPSTASAALEDPISYTLPGERTFPEGMGVDADTGFFYTGSFGDGSIIRGSIYSPTGAEVFLAPGDGRTQTLGVRPHKGLLYVAGNDGRVWVYAIRTKKLLASFRTGARRTLPNDIDVAPNGVAYVTDSYSPYLYRIRRVNGKFRMDRAVSFANTAFRFDNDPAAINADGIAITPNGRYALVNSLTSGQLYRVDLKTRAVKRIALRGAAITNADGMDLDGRQLFVARNVNGHVMRLQMSADYSRVTRRTVYRNPEFRFPTAVGFAPGRLLVLNSQLNAAISNTPPTGPFTVLSVQR